MAGRVNGLHDALSSVMARARAVAADYRQLTGKPLGITGEIGEFEAARLLGLSLAPARQAGFDATDAGGRRLQIKTRRSGPNRGRVPTIRLTHDWDAVLLVLLDESLEPAAIYEADRAAVKKALLAPGSKARNERGALAVSKFRSIGRCVWERR